MLNFDHAIGWTGFFIILILHFGLKKYISVKDKFLRIRSAFLNKTIPIRDIKEINYQTVSQESFLNSLLHSFSKRTIVVLYHNEWYSIIDENVDNLSNKQLDLIKNLCEINPEITNKVIKSTNG